MATTQKSGPSETAIDAATAAIVGNLGSRHRAYKAGAAMHDSALGNDRSVCLRDVLACLEDWNPTIGLTPDDFLRREFGKQVG